MRVLHLYANHKWTGPADLALLLARQLQGDRPEDRPEESSSQEPRLDLDFALAGFVHAGMEHAMRARARELGLSSREGLMLRRHFHLPSLLADAATLGKWILAENIQVLHCHQGGDHLLAALACKLSRPIPIVRSYWEERVSLPWPRQAYAFAATAAVLTPFPGLVDPLVEMHSLPRARVLVQEPVLELPASVEASDRSAARAALRKELGLEEKARLVGITARIQARRRWELCWDIVQELARSDPEVQLVVLGRPDEGIFEEVCERPLQERGVRDRVHFLGYRRGKAYSQALLGLELFLFLVPGSDPTCRALREAMALGLPAVTSDLGHLESIVEEGRCGYCRPAEPRALAGALLELLHDDELARRMGAAASLRARERWGGVQQVKQTLSLYASLLDGRPSALSGDGS